MTFPDFHSPTGEMTLRQLAPDLWTTRAVGTADASMALWLRRGLDAVVLASPRPCLYHDWQELLRYDNEAKVLMTTWTMKNTHIESHILTRSRLVSMAVSVGRLTTRANICGYEDRAPWQARLRDAEVRRQPARLTL